MLPKNLSFYFTCNHNIVRVISFHPNPESFLTIGNLWNNESNTFAELIFCKFLHKPCLPLLFFTPIPSTWCLIHNNQLISSTYRPQQNLMLQIWIPLYVLYNPPPTSFFSNNVYSNPCILIFLLYSSSLII